MNDHFYQDDDARLWSGTANLQAARGEAMEQTHTYVGTIGGTPAVGGEVGDNPKMIQAMKEGKPPMEYLPFGPLADVAWVMSTGAHKYGRRNWLIDKIRATTYVGAIFRHAFLEWARGANKDKDSGRHPLAHVVACCLLVMEAEEQGTLIDDRLFAESKSANQKKEVTHGDR